MKASFIVIFLFVIFFTSCSKSPNEDFAVGRNEQENIQKEKQQKVENSLTEANKIVSAKERERIKSYAERRNITLEEYSGVYFFENRKGNCETIKDNNIVSVRYKCEYLNGEIVEFEGKENTKTFKVSADTDVVFGMKIGVKKLSKGSKAVVIVPDNLAFWLNEQGEKIKASATLVYDLEIIDVK